MKNQFKKSLSLIMAVLMLMSCWVWVAPEKAEAADVTTQYYVILKSNLTDTGDEDGSTVTINFKYSNGKGSSSSVTKSYGAKHTGGKGETILYEGFINGFPTGYSYSMNIDSGRSERHENFQLLVGRDKANCTTLITELDSYTFSDGGTITKSTLSDKYPVLTEGGSTLSAESVTLGKVGTTTASTTKLTLSGFYDQYGVAWGDLSYSYSLSAGDGVTLGTHATMSTSSNTATVSVNPSFQTLFSGKTGAKLYLSWTAATKSGTVAIDVSFPAYTITFDANGGKIGASDSDAKAKIEVTSNKMNIGSLIGKSPAYRSKDGFDFVGFYSDKNADATGLNVSFSGTKFKDDETVVPTQGDITYYAAWKAKPITATFVTADNQLIGTVEGRYNNTLIATNMYNGISGLNAAVKAAYKGSAIQFGSDNAPVYKDGSSTYTFSHWRIIEGYDNAIVDKDHTATLKGDVTFQAVYTKADAKKYAVKFYDGNGNVIDDASNKSDYKFRDDVIMPSTEPSKGQDDKYAYEFIGWANNIGAKYYAVDENGIDATGAYISYTSKEAAEFTVRGDASYVPVFRMVPREYSITFKYKVDGGATESLKVDGYHWGDTPVLPDGIKDNYTANASRYYIDGWKLGNSKVQLSEISVEGDIEITAVYGAGEGAKYTINFYGKDEDGVTDVLLTTGTYSHGEAVTAPEAQQTIETKDVQYSFVAFKDNKGQEFVPVATADADYYAEYSSKTYADIQFFNYDETELTNVITGNFVGDIISADAYTDTPVKPEDATGKYTFIGWNTKLDGTGEDVVLGEYELNGDVKLYAQYSTEYKSYTVKFVDDNGEVLSEKPYRYAAAIEIPENPSKEADKTYKYEFRGWSPEVSVACYGDATYTATYRRAYNYYKVTWLNDNKGVSSSSNYIYDAKINQGVIGDPLNYEAPGAGYTWVLDYWVQCDASGKDILDDNGNQIIFSRGQKMPAEDIFFYPVYKKEANVLTVNFYKEDGTSYIGTAKISYNKNISEYDEAFKEKAIKASNDNFHYAFANWVKVSDGKTAVTTVTENVDVKVVLTEEAHSANPREEVLTASTCNVHGYANLYCTAIGCNYVQYYVELPLVEDNVAPQGQAYIGTTKWASDATIDYDEITYIAPNTQVIANTYDSGSPSRGVARVEYYVSEGGPVDKPSTITDWVEIYNYEAIKNDILDEVLKERKIDKDTYNSYSNNETDGKNKITKVEIDKEVEVKLTAYKANATTVASNLGLENGKEYVIYIRVSDTDPDGKAMRYLSNTAIFSSGTVSYGSTAATVDVSGEGFGTKFCAAADIAISDDCDAYEVYLDGTKLEDVVIEANRSSFDAQLTVEAKGLHTLTVVDKHGNKTVKTFEIKGGHTYRNYTIAATCESDGSRYDLCTVCGTKANIKVLSATGHSYTENFADKAPTCVVDGYRTYICDNNCGIKLVLAFDEETGELNADEVAKAKKYDDATKSWVELEVSDLEHLKATDIHTYAKVKDENGEDTADDAWVVDKAATCIVKGSKHKDCTKCGFRETVEIEIDENAHKFYIAKVTTEPTCTEIGEKTKTCRYCNTSVHVEDIAALGHTDGEYRIIADATCEVAGSKILTCATCGVDIGEEVEIAALGHAWKATGEVYELEGKYYQDYVCRNDATHTKAEEVADYVPPVAATVTFMNGDAVNKVIEGFVGDTITAKQITEQPTKAADDTYTYSFAYWATKNADGSYTEVKFPINVEGDATYYAIFAEKYINYTITYYKEDGVTEFKKTGYLHNGETVELADGPAKAETNTEKYTFAGWQIKDTEDKCGDTVVIDGANIKLVATYTAIDKYYAVTYAYSREDIIHTYTVKASDPAPDVTRDFGDITKDYDTKYHYEFKSWNKSADLVAVVNNVYTTPDFTAIPHDYEVTTKTAATCTTNRIDTYTCKDEFCGYSYDKEIANSALGHSWSEPEYNEETGKTTVSCERENCGVTEENTETYTVKFYLSAEDTKAYDGKNYIPWGSKIAILPIDPSKAETATAEYRFKGWAEMTKDDEGNVTVGEIVDIANLEIKRNYNFVAVFEEIAKVYTVIFAYDAFNKIQTVKNVAADADIVAQFTGATPTKTPDINGHYEFEGWSVGAPEADLVIYVTAKFIKHKHSYASMPLDAATCESGKGTRYWCNCNGNEGFDDKVNGEYVDYYYDETGKPLGHDYAVDRVEEATPEADGHIYYKCTRCDNTKEETVKYQDNKISIQVKVTHNGAAQPGVKVEILEKKVNGTSRVATTNKDGIASIEGIKDTQYVAYVTIDGEKIAVTLNADANGNLTGTYNYNDAATECSCACHRDNVWGTIFRFFHKIIKLFTGEFKCCGNPDPMYG